MSNRPALPRRANAKKKGVVSPCSKRKRGGKKERSNSSQSKAANKGNDKRTLNDGGRVIIHPNIDMLPGREEGNNSRLGCEEHESRDLGSVEDNPLGTGEQSLQSILSIDGDAPMDLNEIENRFIHKAQRRYKESTLTQYKTNFRRLFKEEKLEKYTRRQLASPKGKELLLDHMSNHIKRPSLSAINSALSAVWTDGLDLTWPIDLKRDFGKLPKTERRFTPPDAVIKQWAEALAYEKDPYERLIWLFVAQFGWRPSHASGVRWSDVQYDQEGHPYAIYASGKDRVFKTYAPVLVWLPPDVVKALEEWKAIHPNPNGKGWILPHRSTTASGRLSLARRTDIRQYEKHWEQSRIKHGLPRITPNALRHWVATQCRKVGIDENARAYMQGHDATSYNPGMGAYYDHEAPEEILSVQRRTFPNGPLAAVLPMKVVVESDRDPEALAIFDKYMAGKLGTMEFATLMEGAKIRVLSGLAEDSFLV